MSLFPEVIVTTGHSFAVSEMKSSDLRAHLQRPPLTGDQVSGDNRYINFRNSFIGLNKATLAERFLSTCRRLEDRRSSSATNDTKINSTSWRKQILETNGHWEMWLEGAKG